MEAVYSPYAPHQQHAHLLVTVVIKRKTPLYISTIARFQGVEPLSGHKTNFGFFKSDFVLQ